MTVYQRFFDLLHPSVIKNYSDHAYILDNVCNAAPQNDVKGIHL